MKLIALSISLLFLAGCSENEYPCTQKVEQVATVNGCEVFSVYIPHRAKDKTGDNACYGYGNSFYMTKCPNVTLDWVCGKGCKTSNSTQETK